MLRLYKVFNEYDEMLAAGTREEISKFLGIHKELVSVYEHKMCLNKKNGIKARIDLAGFLGTKVFTAYIDDKKIVSGSANQVGKKLGIDPALVYRYSLFCKQGWKINSYVLGGVLEVREESLK